MVDLLHAQNESFDLLVNGSIIPAVIKSFEIPWTFGGVIWLWPFMLLFLLVIVAIKSESPTMVGIFVILGNIALGTRLSPVSDIIFWITLVLSILIWFFSIFAGKKLE